MGRKTIYRIDQGMKKIVKHEQAQTSTSVSRYRDRFDLFSYIFP